MRDRNERGHKVVEVIWVICDSVIELLKCVESSVWCASVQTLDGHVEVILNATLTVVEVDRHSNLPRDDAMIAITESVVLGVLVTKDLIDVFETCAQEWLFRIRLVLLVVRRPAHSLPTHFGT